MAKSLDDIVSQEAGVKKVRRSFDVGHALGTVGSWVGSGVGAYLGQKFTRNPISAALIGSTVGDYLGYEAGFVPYWYSKHKDRYKGLKGKWKFLKDNVYFNLRALPLDLAAYAVFAPAAIGATLLTGNPVTGTILANIGTDIAYWLGLRFLSRKKFQEVAQQRYNTAPAYNPKYSPAYAKG